jgi:GR25 family glycosyltransferase involved in LPS biosynthesis
MSKKEGIHPLNFYFDKIYCINLAERPDKREKMEKRLYDLGIDVEWFTAVKYDFAPKIVAPIVDSKNGMFNKAQPYEFGAAMSHYTVIKKAYLEGHNQVFIFEDDALFDKKFNTKIKKYLDTVPTDTNIMLLYSFIYDLLPEHTRINARWMKAYKAWSVMAYGIDRKAMEYYIKSQDKFFTQSDGVTYKMQEDPQWKIYSAMPSICVPDSDIGSNIRNTQNYKTHPTVTNMGVSNENYE